MSLFKLIKSESGPLVLPRELSDIQLPHYTINVDKEFRYHENSGNLDTIPESPSNINSVNELVNKLNDKSDYVIFRDFYDYSYDTSNVELEVDRVTYTGDDNKTKITTYDNVHTDQSGLPDNESDLTPFYINYCRIKKFDLIEIPSYLIPDEWGDVIDLSISFWKSNSNDKLTVTKSIKLSQDIKTTTIRYIDLMTEIGTINYNDVPCTYTNESGTGDIVWSKFHKGNSVNEFEVVSCYDNLFIYCIDPLVTDYYISSCKINSY